MLTVKQDFFYRKTFFDSKKLPSTIFNLSKLLTKSVDSTPKTLKINKIKLKPLKQVDETFLKDSDILPLLSIRSSLFSSERKPFKKIKNKKLKRRARKFLDRLEEIFFISRSALIRNNARKIGINQQISGIKKAFKLVYFRKISKKIKSVHVFELKRYWTETVFIDFPKNSLLSKELPEAKNWFSRKNN